MISFAIDHYNPKCINQIPFFQTTKLPRPTGLPVRVGDHCRFMPAPSAAVTTAPPFASRRGSLSRPVKATLRLSAMVRDVKSVQDLADIATETTCVRKTASYSCLKPLTNEAKRKLDPFELVENTGATKPKQQVTQIMPADSSSVCSKLVVMADCEKVLQTLHAKAARNSSEFDDSVASFLSEQTDLLDVRLDISVASGKLVCDLICCSNLLVFDRHQWSCWSFAQHWRPAYGMWGCYSWSRHQCNVVGHGLSRGRGVIAAREQKRRVGSTTFKGFYFLIKNTSWLGTMFRAYPNHRSMRNELICRTSSSCSPLELLWSFNLIRVKLKGCRIPLILKNSSVPYWNINLWLGITFKGRGTFPGARWHEGNDGFWFFHREWCWRARWIWIKQTG